jgi:hypothetical protein
MIAGFTAGERDYIRRELDMFFSTLPTVAEGFQLKTWRGGPDAGKPKLPPTAKGLIARGLMRLDNEGHFPRLFFTEADLTALRAMMTDRRLVDPKKFAHVRQELGIYPSILVPRTTRETETAVWSRPTAYSGGMGIQGGMSQGGPHLSYSTTPPYLSVCS